MTTTRQVNVALNNFSRFIARDVKTTLGNIGIILMGFEHEEGNSHINFYERYQHIETKVDALNGRFERLQSSLSSNQALEQATRLLQNQPSLYRQILAPLKILKHTYKGQALASALTVMSGIKGNLDALSGAISVTDNVVNPLQTALAVPSVAAGILETIFGALVADEKRQQTATELALQGLVLEQNASATLQDTIANLQKAHNGEAQDARSIALEVGQLGDLITRTLNTVDDDIQTLEGLSDQTQLIQNKAQNLRQLRDDVVGLCRNFEVVRDTLAGQDLKGGALKTLVDERQRQAQGLIHNAKVYEATLRETLLSFQTYILRKSDGHQTGLTAALESEKITHRDGLLRFERALLKVGALDKVLEEETFGSVHLLDRKGNHNEEYQMEKLCGIERKTHARVSQMSHGFTGQQVQLFLFALIHSIRKESLHVVTVNNNYIRSVTTLISSVFRAFRADKKYGISRESYNNGFKVIQEMSKGGELRNLLNQQGEGATIQTLFSTFNNAYQQAEVNLHAGGTTRL